MKMAAFAAIAALCASSTYGSSIPIEFYLKPHLMVPRLPEAARSKYSPTCNSQLKNTAIKKQHRGKNSPLHLHLLHDIDTAAFLLLVH